jgi:hypothetical protein
MPSLPSGSYQCEASSSYRNVDGTGWIPVNFNKIPNGSPLGSLRVDPTNRSSSNLFYTYQTNGTQFELTAVMESQKYQSLASTSGGPYNNLYVKGSNLALALTDYASPTVATGTVSQNNMKLSLANNTAFVDFSSAGALTSYIGDELIITDHSGNQLIGWIKAAGTGETYGSQLLPNPSLTTLTGIGNYNATPSIVGSGGQSGGAYLRVSLTSAYGWANQNFSLTSGMLVRNTVYMKAGTETNWLWFYMADPSYNQLNGPNYSNEPSSWTQSAMYATADLTSSGFMQVYEGATSGQTSLYDTASAVQVLTPSTTGVTIVSTSGGSAYNWSSEQSGFNRNDSNGYTYSIVL